MVDVLVMFLEQFVIFPSGVVHCPSVVQAGLGLEAVPKRWLNRFSLLKGGSAQKSALLLFMPSMTVVPQ